MTLALVLALSLCAAPSEEELTRFGQALAADFRAGQDAVSPRTDLDALVDRTLKDIPVSPARRQAFTKGLRGSFSGPWLATAAEMLKGGDVVYRRNATLDGIPVVQLRIRYQDGTVSFLEFLADKRPSGDLRIIDIYDAGSGTLRSADGRMLVLSMLGQTEPTLVERLLGKERALSPHFPALKKMHEAISTGRPADARALWAGLPTDVQEHRLFFRQYLLSVAQGDDAEYERGLARYLALYPEDPAAQMMAIDLYYLRQKWPGCRLALDTLEKRTGPDAWFDLMRGLVALQEGKVAEGRSQLEAAIAKEPALKESWLPLIDLALGARRWAEAAGRMSAAETQAGLSFDLGSERFVDFVASKEGAAWARAHRQPAPKKSAP